MIRSFTIIMLVLLLTACELLPMPKSQPVAQTAPRTCVFNANQESTTPDWQMSATDPACELKYWLTLWRDAGTKSWKQRKQLIDSLTDSPDDQLRQYFLSQPIDTPYQVRLRAQNVFNGLRPYLHEYTHSLLEQIAYKPSQQLLEFESAITILSKVNARHAKTNEEQAQLLLEQEEKINQLLNIEASILDKNSER